jgi:hypothetical protein
VSGTINLASELPVITDFLWITGPGANLLTVRRDTGGDYGIFTCVAAQLNISGLAIANGGVPQFEGEGAVSNSMKQEGTGPGANSGSAHSGFAYLPPSTIFPRA